MSDIVFGIGGDNTELKRSTTEADRIIDEWVQRVEDKVDDVGSVEIEVETPNTDGLNLGPVDIPVEIDASGVKDFFASANGDADRLIERVIRVSGAIGTVVSVTATVLSATESVAREWSGYNDAIEKSNDLLARTASLTKDIQNADINRLVEGGDRDALAETFEKALAASRRLREEQEKAQASVDEAGFAIGNRDGEIRPTFTSQLREELTAANEELAEADKNVESLRAALGRLDEAEEQRSKADEERARKREANFKRELENLEIKRARAAGNDELADSLESDQRVNDDIARGRTPDQAAEAEAARQGVDDAEDAAKAEAANKRTEERIRLLQLQTDVTNEVAGAQEKLDQFRASQQTDDPSQAGRVAAAEAELRAAKEAADARRESAIEQDRLRRDTERFEERLATQRERNAESEARVSERRGRLQRRQERDRERANRPIGGVDSSLQAAISRIQESANKPDPLNDLAEKHQAENRTFEATAARERAKQTAILERMEKKRPAESPGLL